MPGAGNRKSGRNVASTSKRVSKSTRTVDQKEHDNAMSRLRYHAKKDKTEIRDEHSKLSRKDKRAWSQKFDAVGNFGFVQCKKSKQEKRKRVHRRFFVLSYHFLF